MSTDRTCRPDHDPLQNWWAVSLTVVDRKGKAGQSPPRFLPTVSCLAYSQAARHPLANPSSQTARLLIYRLAEIRGDNSDTLRPCSDMNEVSQADDNGGKESWSWEQWFWLWKSSWECCDRFCWCINVRCRGLRNSQYRTKRPYVTGWEKEGCLCVFYRKKRMRGYRQNIFIALWRHGTSLTFDPSYYTIVPLCASWSHRLMPVVLTGHSIKWLKV